MKEWIQLNLFPFYDLTGMAEHLEEMAGKGWKLKKAGTFLWHYEKAEKEKLRYALCWGGEAEVYEPKNGQPHSFRQQAAEKGWEPALITDRLQVYSSREEKPEQLSVSPYDRIMGISQAAKPHLFMHGAFVVLGILSVLLLIFKLHIMPVAAMASGFSLMVPIALSLLSIYFIFEGISYAVLKNRAEIAATEKNYEVSHLPAEKIHFWILTAALILIGLGAVTTAGNPMVGTFFICLISILSIFLILKAVRNAVQGKSKVLTVITDCILAVILVVGVALSVNGINHAEAGFNGVLPVTAQTLGIRGKDSILEDYLRSHASLLLRYTEASQVEKKEDGTYAPVLSYEMVEGIGAPVDGMVLKHYLNRMASSARRDDQGDVQPVRYKSIAEGPWQAEKAWQMTDGTVDFNVYLILYENILVELGVPEPLSDAQKGIFGAEILK